MLRCIRARVACKPALEMQLGARPCCGLGHVSPMTARTRILPILTFLFLTALRQLLPLPSLPAARGLAMMHEASRGLPGRIGASDAQMHRHHATKQYLGCYLDHCHDADALRSSDWTRPASLVALRESRRTPARAQCSDQLTCSAGSCPETVYGVSRLCRAGLECGVIALPATNPGHTTTARISPQAAHKHRLRTYTCTSGPHNLHRRSERPS